MDIDVYVENVIIDDSPVYMVYPDDEIYSEVVGVAESQEEALSDFAGSFNQMMYSDNDIPSLLKHRKRQGRSFATLSCLI